MKKYFKYYLIFIIFLLFCTGCNNNQQLIRIGDDGSGSKDEVTRYKNGAVMIKDENDNSDDKDHKFDVGKINFGPGKIKFGDEK